jgi:hypothetical protein
MNYQPLFSISLLDSRWENEFRDFQSSAEATALQDRQRETLRDGALSMSMESKF